jgi:hypothetical protein
VRYGSGRAMGPLLFADLSLDKAILQDVELDQFES